jgi:hypothetical protein
LTEEVTKQKYYMDGIEKGHGGGRLNSLTTQENTACNNGTVTDKTVTKFCTEFLSCYYPEQFH